jgi:hypothetical protein
MYTGIQLHKLVKETPHYINIKVRDTSMAAGANNSPEDGDGISMKCWYLPSAVYTWAQPKRITGSSSPP